MIRRTPLQRSTKPIARSPLPARTKTVRKVRSKPRPGRLDAAGVQAQRVRIFARDSGKCIDCGTQVIFNAPEEWDNSFHRAHIKNKRMYGDDDSNVKTNCGRCHRRFHQCGPSMQKPVPPKVR